MIEVQHLSKVFGAVHAVDDVSFTVGRGEILGFLGPNGAGKTTTMRVLTGYLPATSGAAKVAGYDVAEQSLDVRRHIGYLPENPPLYPDMSVGSYLDFVARIKGVASADRRARVTSALEMTNITDKRAELIKRLSRGYKQRVGLAQALVHNPDVIILDEPTVGLDPKQIIEVRHLIKSLSGSHTIILSTHILPEVSMTCDRVVIINRGRIAAVDTPGNLTAQLRGGERVRLEGRAVAAKGGVVRDAEIFALLQGVNGVRSVQMAPMGAGRGFVATIECHPGHDVRGALAAKVVGAGHELLELRGLAMSLEDIFLQLTTDEAAPHAGEAKKQ